MILGAGAVDHEPGIDFLGFSLIFIGFPWLFDGSGCRGRLPGALFQLFAVAGCGSLWQAVGRCGPLWQVLAG